MSVVALVIAPSIALNLDTMSEKVAYEWSGRDYGLNGIIGSYVNIKVFKRQA